MDLELTHKPSAEYQELLDLQETLVVLGKMSLHDAQLYSFDLGAHEGIIIGLTMAKETMDKVKASRDEQNPTTK